MIWASLILALDINCILAHNFEQVLFESAKTLDSLLKNGEKGYKHSWIEFAHLKNYGFLVHIKCGCKLQSSKTGLALL